MTPQHGTDLSRLTTSTFTAIAHYGVPGLVRVAQNDPVDIGGALDLGAAGVMVPMVDTAEDAAAAVAACRYAPVGNRSYGMQTSRIDPLAEDYRPICAIQVETAAARENIDLIAAVEGVDWLYIGPADFGLAIGGVPAPDVTTVFEGSHLLATKLAAGFGAVVDAATAHDKLAGLHTSSGKATVIAEEHGFRVSCVAADLGTMRAGMADQLNLVRNSD